jgi:hypothetical protein
MAMVIVTVSGATYYDGKCFVMRTQVTDGQLWAANTLQPRRQWLRLLPATVSQA